MELPPRIPRLDDFLTFRLVVDALDSLSPLPLL